MGISDSQTSQPAPFATKPIDYMDAFLPGNRKAKLWDLFVELYGDISKEAEDDFHALFGKEFLKAYEAQIAELERLADAQRDDARR